MPKLNCSPRTLWKLGRAALEDVSPDGGSVVYSVTYFNIVANKGNTDLYVCKTDGTTPPVKITNYEGHENNARFTPDGKKSCFLQMVSFIPAILMEAINTNSLTWR